MSMATTFKLEPGQYVKVLTGNGDRPKQEVYVLHVVPGGFFGLAHAMKHDRVGPGGTNIIFYPDSVIDKPKAEAGVFYSGPGQAVGVGQADGSLRLVYCTAGRPTKGVLKMEFDPDAYTKQS